MRYIYLISLKDHFDQLTGIGTERAELGSPGAGMPTDQRPILGQLGMG